MNNLLGILFLAASATIGYFMNQSATSEQIWGYETFFCLFFLWASILSFFGKWISSLANKKQLLRPN